MLSQFEDFPSLDRFQAEIIVDLFGVANIELTHLNNKLVESVIMKRQHDF